MCGLAGVARIGGGALNEAADDLLRRMTHAVAHRGPDDEAYFRDGPVGLGFVRLSLVDPAGGGQPLFSPDGSVVLIANGEIYNHEELRAGLPAGTPFKTGSDCEVLIHLYQRDGFAFLDKVRGMFAFVLYDSRRNLLLFARDRFGVKSVFFHQNGERIVFGSEIKALFQDPGTPRELDWERALSDQLVTGLPAFDDSAPNVWFRDIEVAPAATITAIDLATGQRTVHKYWEFPRITGDGEASEDELVRSYRDILTSSVTEACMADVEIGLFLSGGIDSAAVGALSSVRTRTFTALNGSTLANGDGEWGHRIAASLGLPNDQVLFDTTQVPGVQEWRQLVWLMETPMAGPEAYYKYEMYRYVGAHAPEVKAMLLGGGSDEFNGGYSVQMAEGGDWNDFTANLARMNSRRGLLLRPALSAWWEHSELPLLNTAVLDEVLGEQAYDPYEMLFRWKYRDIQMHNCWHDDRTAAGNGIEARVPFLDHRLIELVAAIPPALRPELIWDKQIVRRALEGALREDILHRPKVPFYYGDGAHHTYRAFSRMLAQDGGALIEEALSGPGARRFLDADNVRATVARLAQDPKSGHVEFVLRVVNLGLMEQFTATMPGAHVDAPRAAIPIGVPVTDWDDDHPMIEGLVLHRPVATPDQVLELDERVLLLHSPADPSTWYVLIDGAIEFVVTEEDNPDWIRLLQALDGEHDLGTLLAALDCPLESVADLLSEALELELVRVAQADG